MKTHFLFKKRDVFALLVLLLAITSTSFSQLPDLLYYKFERNPTPLTVVNCGNAGTPIAPMTGLTLTSGGQYDSCITGSGVTGAGVVTGWNNSLGTSSWTIGMWVDIPTTTFGYLFGDGAGSFRCFNNGAAGTNAITLRGTGITNVNVTGFASGPVYVHFVYDSALANIKVYKNGVLDVTVAQTPLNLAAGTGFKVGGYTTVAGFTGKMDEFRVYRRALSQAEITATWNTDIGDCLVPPGQLMTLCRGGLNLLIPDHSTLRDSVNVVLGAGCNVLDVNVRIDTVIHTWDSDLSFYLTKGTTGVKIINKVGGSGDNFINTVLNDSATTLIGSGTAPFTGSYRPSSPLTPFNGPFSSGYWRLTITDTATGDTGFLRRWCLVITYDCPTGGVQTVEIPNYYSLTQNFPNPFNPETTIKFAIPQTEKVKIVVFDILGREVTTLVNELRNAGTYSVKFDASSLSSGVYFYSIQTPNFTETKKMLLVK